MTDHEPIERCTKCKGSGELDIAWECLPVPVFGGLKFDKIRVATVGLNPSLHEWFEMGKWKPTADRLSAIVDFKVENRERLEDEDVEAAVAKRANYFSDVGRSWNEWFESFDALLGRVNSLWSYASGTAVHLDIVACPTRMRFGKIPVKSREAMLKNCFVHFKRSLEKLPSDIPLLLNGDLILKNLQQLGCAITFDGPEELVMLTPKVLGFKGTLRIERLQFAFRCWTLPVRKLHPRERLDLAIWLRGNLFSAKSV